jgi:hypothetical protein
MRPLGPARAAGTTYYPAGGPNAGKVEAITDAAGYTIQYQYTTGTDPQGHTIYIQYVTDQLGQNPGPGPHTTEIDEDGSGNVIKKVTPNRVTTTNQYAPPVGHSRPTS